MSLLNNLSINAVNKSSYASHYNTLPAVQEADLALRSSSCFQDVLEKVATITQRYQCESFIGLRLIHKHFPLKEGQLMVEDFQDIKGSPSLVTHAQTWEHALNISALPSSWIFTEEGEVQTFEASVDSAVKTGIDFIESHPEMMQEIKEVLQEHQLNTILAVAILKRNSLKVSDSQMYFEKESFDESTSIIQVWDRKDPQSSQGIINTSWGFEGSSDQKPRIKVMTGCTDKNKT